MEEDNRKNLGCISEDDTDDVVILKVDQTEIYCSRQLLARHSDYFNAMFQSQMKESAAATIELKGINSDALRKIIEFMKTEHCNLCADNIESITEIACMYQLKKMIEYCCIYMETHLADDTCLTTLMLADAFSLIALYNKARQHIVWFFNQVTAARDFLTVDHADVIADILNDKLLNVSGEMEVFEAVEKWVLYKPVERKSHIRDLMKCVHVEDLTCTEMNFLRENCLLSDYQDCLVCDSKKDNHTQRKYRQIPHMLLLVGGESIEEDEHLEPYQYILKYDPDQGKFDSRNPYSDLKGVHENTGLEMGYSVCTDGKDIYVSGGEVSRGKNNWDYGVWCFDTFKQTWEKVAKLQSPRRHHATCVHQNHLYFVGGFGKFRVKLDSVNAFHLIKKEWNALQPLPEHAFSLGLCACKDKLYAFKEQIHSYDPTTNVWTTLLRNTDRRFAASHLMCCDHQIFCVSRFSSEVLCYNTDTNSIDCVGNFNCKESLSVNATLHNGRIFKVSHSDLEEHCQLEQFDPVTRTLGNCSVHFSGVDLVNFYLVSVLFISDFR